MVFLKPVNPRRIHKPAANLRSNAEDDSRIDYNSRRLFCWLEQDLVTINQSSTLYSLLEVLKSILDDPRHFKITFRREVACHAFGHADVQVVEYLLH